MKMVEEDMEGEVVMVRLGADEGGIETEENVEQGSSYMELKPSTTLLVPLELMEGQHGLVDSAQLCLPEIQQMVVPDDPRTETHSGFSLMLDMDEDGNKEADTLPMENYLLSSNLSTQSPVEETSEELVAKPELILLGTDEQDAPLSGEVSQDDQRKEMDILDGIEADGLKESEPVNLQTDQLLDITGTSQETEFVTLARDHEPEALSVPTAVEELPAVVDDENFVARKDAADEELGEEENKPSSVQDQEAPEENGTVNTDAEIVPSAEMAPAVEEHRQDRRILEETEEDNTEEITKEKETRRSTRGRQRKHHVEEKPVKQVLSSNSEPEEQPVPETPTSQRKKAPSTPTRRTTRGRRTVTFISPLPEDAEEPQEAVAETEISTLEVPASPSRTPRKSKQSKEIKVQASTPRRSTRKAHAEPPKEEVEEGEAVDNNTTVASVSKASSPARRRASQRATSKRTSQSNQTGSEEVSVATEVEIKEEDPDEEVTHIKVGRRTSSKTPTPSKRRTTQANTPRRSSRRILSSSKVESTSLEIVKEEKEKEEVFAPPVKRSSKKTQPTLLEEDEEQQDSSPGRTTRQSNRITLNVYPQVKLVPVSLPQSAKKTRCETITENIKESEDLLESELNSNTSHTNSHRPTRSKLWDHPEEDLPLLDSPLEVDSETPVADALIKRLQDEEEKQEGGVVISKVVRTSKRSTKSSAEQTLSLPPVKDSVVPEPEEDESSPGEHSFIYSPSRRRTRARRAESPGPSEESVAPITRSRRVKEVSPHDAVASEEDHLEVEKAAGVSKTRKTGKRAAKSKGVSEPPPITEVELISPLPSPASPLPRTQKRTKEDAPTSSMNLRRKRIMDTVFTKPVTRRKKL